MSGFKNLSGLKLEGPWEMVYQVKAPATKPDVY